MNRADYEANFNDATTGSFRDGQPEGSITEATMRDLVTKTADNTLFFDDDVLDEDGMSSDSDTKVPTQQSVKAYVDNSITASINGATFKTNVKAASAAGVSLTLSGEQTIDGVSCVAGDRVLAKNQSTASENGIYVVAVGAWSRSSDANDAAELNGAAVYVTSGTTNGASRWQQVSTIVTVGTDAVQWLPLGTVVDEDDMASDSAVRVPSQQSTKAYVDRLNWKPKCKVATTANITLSGAQTIDDIALIAGDFVLVKNQSTASQNGIYVVSAGSWTRRSDSDTSTELTDSIVFVSDGTINANTTWVENGGVYSFVEFQKALAPTNATTDASSITLNMRNKAYQRFQLETDESAIAISFSNYDVGSTADLFITKQISGTVTLSVMTSTLVREANGSGLNLISLTGADGSVHHIRFYFMGTATQYSLLGAAPDNLFENLHVNSRTKAWYCTTESSGKVRKSTDGGSNWTLKKTAATPLADVHFDSTGTYGIAAGGNTTSAVTVTITTDGGDTWSDKTISGISSSYLIGGCICEDVNTYLVVGANGEIWKTTDQGANWTNIKPVGTTNQLTDIFRLSANNYFVSGFGGYIRKTTDGGSNWTNISTASIASSDIYGVCFVDANTGFIAAQGSGTYEGIWKTTDGGTTWTRVRTGDYEEIWALNSNVVFATNSSGVYYSLNGGSNWVDTGLAAYFGAVWGSSIDNILTIGYSSGAVYKFFTNSMNTVYEYGS